MHLRTHVTAFALVLAAFSTEVMAQERTKPMPERAPAERPKTEAPKPESTRGEPARPESSRGEQPVRPEPSRSDEVRRDLPQRQPEIPAEMMPPAGKCRIWMDGVSPAQQPAPTDCKTALRQRTATGVVIFGPTEKRALPMSGFRSQPRPARRDTTKRPTAERARPERDTMPSASRRVPVPTSKQPNSAPPTRRRPDVPREERPF